jgi:two-component system, NarL family, response regulator LiaR
MIGQAQTNIVHIGVLIVDDHPVSRAGLGVFIDAQSDLRLVGEAESGEEALALCEKLKPDVVLMDMKLPGMDGVSATAIIKQLHPQIQVVALSAFQDREWVERALQAGAISYLLKTSTAHELAYAIRAAHTGRSMLSPEATDSLVQSVHKRSGWVDLTEREREVMALLAEGYTNAQIAERLCVTLATAKFHVGGVLSKLGVGSRAEAVTVYWQNQLTRRVGSLEATSAA